MEALNTQLETQAPRKPKFIPPPQWKKGQSGNPAGRPKKYQSAGEYARKKTKQGKEFIDYLLRIWRDEKQEDARRDWACTQLMERAIGKPVSTLELSESGGAGGLVLQVISFAQFAQVAAPERPAIEVKSYETESESRTETDNAPQVADNVK